ncbi:MAG: pseudaminic acid cytidylyltransferase [Chlamydiota bacterium]
MRLAVIPARGGSKRILRKNIKYFHGKPIIAYSIVALQESGLFDEIIVSTDDQEIAEIAQTYGAEVPFVRPAHLADDYTSTSAVIRHAIEWHEKRGATIDEVCCLYATAPFVLPEDLADAMKLLKGETSCVFSAVEFSYPIFRAFSLDDNERPKMFWPENFNKRSQDLEKAYHDAGMFYIAKPTVFLEEQQLFSGCSRAYILPSYRVQDIDTLDDWHRAEKLYRLLED